ncbi:MAG: nucleotide exchange factor GrpE [Patescibacteria group bacterium]|nr:nucleotide exchange factor GrpE [Patescibacteria group bacterium]
MTKKEKHQDNSKMEEIENKIAELTSGWQRTQADFINYKKQVNEERAKFCRTANSDLVYELLPVLDNFQLAARHIPENLENDNWAQGIKQIEKQFEDILTSVGLKRIESVGQHFNPEFHEAVEEVESDKPEGEIVEEVLAGYKFDNDVLRPAKVRVSKGDTHGERSEA